MQKIIFILKVTVIVLAICSCSPKSFVGEITAIKSDTVCLPKQCFKLLPNAPRSKLGNKAVFKETRNKKIVNCIKIK